MRNSASEQMSREGRTSKPATVERAAWLAVGLLAAGLRFFQLGLRPLSEGEAAQALAAFRFVRGAISIAPAGTNPALFTGNVVGFTLLGASDITSRWLPAVMGLILVLLPYGLRHRLGRGGALAAALLLALSPSAIYFSRALDGAILVAACSLALAVGLIRFLDRHQPGALYLAAWAAGLGLCAGPAFYTVLLVLAVFGLAFYLVGRWLERAGARLSLLEGWPDWRGHEGRAAVVLAATFGLVATTFALHPSGVANAADLIGDWATGVLSEPGGQPMLYPLLLLLRYEPLIWVLGLFEAGWVVFNRRKAQGRMHVRLGDGDPRPAPAVWPSLHTPLLIFWAMAATFVVLVSGHRPAGNILLIIVPLALLAGQGLERAWRWVSRGALWPSASIVAAAALGLAVFLYLHIAAYALSNEAATPSLAGLSLPNSTLYLLLVSLAVILLLGLGAVTWIWQGRGSAFAGGWLATVVALGLFGFKAAWALNHAHAADPRQIMNESATAPDVRAFVAEMEALSHDKSGDAHTLPITVQAATGPVVAWYLREFSQQKTVESLFTPPDTVAAVTLAPDAARGQAPDGTRGLGRQELPIGESFRGRGFPLRSRWQPWGLGVKSAILWLLYDSATLPTVDRKVVLWVAAQP